MVGLFQQASIDEFMAKTISGFSNTQYNVYLSSGPSYQPILVSVRQFHAKDESILLFKKIVTGGAIKKSTSVWSHSPPLGINPGQDLGEKLMEHVQNIAEVEPDHGEVLYRNVSNLTWDVHEAIWSY